jgi:hypothetical protein
MELDAHCTYIYEERTKSLYCKGESYWIFEVLYSTLLHSRLSDSTVSEDAGSEPRTVAMFAFTVGRSNQSVRSHLLEIRFLCTVYVQFVLKCIGKIPFIEEVLNKTACLRLQTKKG